jgi:2-isopropylmalate synthase
MSEPTPDALIYDWNAAERRQSIARKAFRLHDETMRDGIQNPSVIDPGIGDKLEILHLLNDLGVDSVNVGLPGAGPRPFEDTLRLCKEIADNKLAIRPGCAARTVVADIAPIAEVSQATGLPVEVMTFIGSSPIRQLAEDWSLDLIRKRSVDAVGFAVKEDLPTTYVTEDTTRSRPDVLSDLFRSVIDVGAKRLCLCDTVGHATPDGVRNLIHFTRSIIEASGQSIGIDWHGHNDRGLALENTLWALEFGADRLHGCVLGIGERVGNAPLDLLLINLRLLGELGERNLSHLAALCQVVSRSTRFPIPINYPVVGDDAFRTGTGVHASAIIKALEKGDVNLADQVYSGVPAAMFGRKQDIRIGPMSGASNVTFWLKERNIEPERALIDAILKLAKQSDHLLSDEEVNAVIDRHRSTDKA